MKSCPQCKKLMPESNTVCIECGHRFKTTNQINEQKKVQKVETSIKIENKPNSTQTKINQPSQPEIPVAHYLFLPVSIFFGIFWFIPLIGVILSFVAITTLEEQKTKNIDVGSHVGFTIGAGAVHVIYVLSALFRG